MIPVTRKEQYLNRLTGEGQAIPETPVTRTEQYLAKLCGEETEIPNSPITREELYLAYLNGEDVTLPEPITRLEQFMAYAASKSETKPTPLTREEFYWDKYHGGAVLKDFPDLPASIVTVTDALAKPLDSLKVAITPVQAGSGDPSPENVRPISGWTECNVTRTGKNLFYRKIYSRGLDSNGNVVSASTYNLFVACVKAGVTYQNSVDGGAKTAVRAFFTSPPYSGSESYNGIRYAIRTSFTAPIDGYVAVRANNDATNAQLEIGDQETTYEPYTGQDYSIPFPSEAGTVYGGTLDVTNGTLTVTKANIASYDGETLPGAWISDRDVYAEGTTPTTGAQVVYDLDTPITYQLTPTEITMLLGTNNIWADTGDIMEGKYWSKNPVTVTRAMLNTVRDTGEITEITPTEEPEENDER